MLDLEISDNSYYILITVLSFGIATAMTYAIRMAIRYVIKKRWEDGDEDVTRLKFLGNSVSAVFYTLALAYIFFEIPVLSHLGTAIFAGAGVVAAVIGFASQKAFSNIISGVFILLFRPFKVGDAVTVSGHSGLIEDITLRHTVIKNYENRRVIIPNNVISDQTIVNSNITDETIRQQVFFGISYESDLDRATALIQEEALNHHLSLDFRSKEEKAKGGHPVVVRVMSWDDSSVKLRAQIWTTGIDDGFVLKCDLLKSVKERFEKEGIEIPYPHRTLVMKDGQSLMPAGNS
jgi:small conductance mechanosensitive channel